MSERLIEANGVELCTQSFGDPADMPVLLIMGAMASMVRWEDEFCERLADAGRFVMRYDHRDTGRSTSCAPGAPTHTVSDLVDDAAAVIEAYGLDFAHVVGMSLGGLLGQRLAVRYPARVRSLVAVMTMPYAVDLPEAPVLNEGFVEHLGKAADLDWSDRAAVVDWIVGKWQRLAGSGHVFDEPRSRRLAEIEFDRARDIATMCNFIVLDDDVRLEEGPDAVKVPVLVLHGTDDPIIPYVYGETLAEIVGAKLITLRGSGHELHEDDWNTLLTAIVEHTARNA